MYCSGCGRSFPSRDSIRTHYVNSSMHSYCRQCDEHFNDDEDLEEHYDAQHYHCASCDKFFQNDRGLNDHYRQSPQHHYCVSCERHFGSERALEEHYAKSSLHSYCQSCEMLFDDDEELDEHRDECHHWCKACARLFKNDFGLKEHWRQSDRHSYCAPCDRHFQSENNLQSHLRSSVHTPRDVPCRGPGCNLTFVSVSAMLLHLESGTCVSGINRPLINARVKELDRNNVITRPDRLLTGGSSSYIATSRSYNPYLEAYECVLCHGTFGSLPALNQHLASPKHEEKMYVCPLGSCGVKFKTLSGLCAHVESEKCGVKRFREVKSVMDGIVNRMGRLTV